MHHASPDKQKPQVDGAHRRGLRFAAADRYDPRWAAFRAGALACHQGHTPKVVSELNERLT